MFIKNRSSHIDVYIFLLSLSLFSHYYSISYRNLFTCVCLFYFIIMRENRRDLLVWRDPTDPSKLYVFKSCTNSSHKLGSPWHDENENACSLLLINNYIKTTRLTKVLRKTPLYRRIWTCCANHLFRRRRDSRAFSFGRFPVVQCRRFGEGPK